MVSRFKPTPVLCAACGAAVGFYCLGALYRGGLIGPAVLFVCAFAPVAALCLFRVLATFPLCAEGPRFRSLRLTERYLAALSAGVAIGIGAGAAVTHTVSFGIPEHALRGVSGVLREDPRVVSGGRAMATLSLREAGGAGGLRVSARGELPVFFPEESAGRLKEFGRGTTVFAEGKLRRGGAGTGAGSTEWLFSAESLHIVQAAPALERFRTGLRLGLTRRFARAAGTASGDGSWPGLALALLLGIRDNLDSTLAARYRDAGCSYVLALSGMHLAVLAAIIAFLLKKPLGLRAASIAGAVIIILYCGIVGPLPSLTRAALMYLLGTLAVVGALKRDPLSLLGMAFLVQIIIAPASGCSLSFILSYLALAGILIIGEALNSLLSGAIPAMLLQPLSASLGAFLATAAVSAWFFGELRPVGIVTGLVLVPLTTVFMIGSIGWLALNIIAPPLSRLAAPPLSLLYGLMEKTVSLADKAPALTLNRYAALWLSLGIMLCIALLERRVRASANRLDSLA
jgi:competence protein ComEC